MAGDQFDEWLAASNSTRAFGVRTGETTVSDEVDDLYTENYLEAVTKLGEGQARELAALMTRKQLVAMHGATDGARAWQLYRDECTQLGPPDEDGLRDERNLRRLGPAWAGVEKQIS